VGGLEEAIERPVGAEAGENGDLFVRQGSGPKELLGVGELLSAQVIAGRQPGDCRDRAAEIFGAEAEVGGELGDASGGSAAAAVAEVMGGGALEALAVEVRIGVCSSRHSVREKPPEAGLGSGRGAHGRRFRDGHRRFSQAECRRGRRPYLRGRKKEVGISGLGPNSTRAG